MIHEISYNLEKLYKIRNSVRRIQDALEQTASTMMTSDERSTQHFIWRWCVASSGSSIQDLLNYNRNDFLACIPYVDMVMAAIDLEYKKLLLTCKDPQLISS